VPDGGVVEAEGRRPGRWRRAWRHRSVKVVALVLAVVVVATGAGAGWLVWRYHQLPRTAADVAPREDGQPENFLLVGSDSRAFVDGDLDVAAYGTAAEVGEPHADTILLVRTFPQLDRVAMISFPRDLWLPIAGTGSEDRINTAVQGGATQLIQTITDDFGIPVHHFAEIDFRGFKGIVNAIGGVNVYFPAPVRDFDTDLGRTLTGLDIADPGCIRLDGDQALAYVRSRHYQQLVDGEWQSDPAGDLNRIQRQQDFIRRTFNQALSKGLLDPRRVDKLLRTARDNVTLDDSLGLRDLLDLGRRFGSLTPDALQTYAVPTTPGTTAGGASVLYLDREAADPVLDVFRGKTLEPDVALPSTVRVQVLNASGRSGAVRAAAYRLAAAGFSVPGVGDLGAKLDRTRIRFGTGQQAAAELLAGRVLPAPELVSDETIVGVDVVLDIGRDWQRVLEPGEDPPSTTSTTAPSTTAGAPAAGPTTVAPTTAPPAGGAAGC
jgi:LCP family protein required for cell wall assembly